MKLDNLKYGKDNGSWNYLKGHDLQNQKPVEPHVSLPSIQLPSDYTKPEGEIDVRMLFILSGGEDREYNYFKMLKDDQKLRRIKVAFASKKGQGMNPTQLLDAAKYSVKNKKFTTSEATYRFEEDNGDIIYLLQDIDEFEQEIQKLATKEQPYCLRWVYSNPAFEMWLYYHYFEEPLPNLKDAIDKTPAKRSKWLKKHLNEIIRGGVNTTKAIKMIRTAVVNSKANYQETAGLPSLFSTQMYMLAEDILNTMGDEFDKMLDRKAEFNRRMMKKFSKPMVKSIRYDGNKIRSLIDDLSKWANRHPLRLPNTEIVGENGSHYFDNKAFPVSYKIVKAYLDDESDEPMPIDQAELFMEKIQEEIYHFYHILFIQNSPIYSYTIDFSEIKDTIELLGLDSNYAILSSFHLHTFDALYGGEPLVVTDWGYKYKDIKIHLIPARGRFMIIMRKDYLPKADFKPYEGDNPEFEQIDDKNFIYSNIHRMKELVDYYGLSVMRTVRFQLPQKGSFRFIKLNIEDHTNGTSELNKMSRANAVNLQYQEEDFVMYKDKIKMIIGILEDGEIKLHDTEELVGIDDISPVRINGVLDADIYYDPIVAAFMVDPDEAIPYITVDDRYYMESFKKEILEDGARLYDKVANCHFAYVHELQHWLLKTTGQSGLKIKSKSKVL